MATMSPGTWELRQQILRRYGGMCQCPCGCQDPCLRRLQLDHIEDGGTQERRTIRGQRLYQKLLATPVNPALQLLCAGCHFEKSMFGACTGGTVREHTPGVTEVRQGRDTRVDGHLSIDRVDTTPHVVVLPHTKPLTKWWRKW